MRSYRIPRRRTPSLEGLFERDDLTAYARIRNAALDLFAEHGVAATLVREIAARGRVSRAMLARAWLNPELVGAQR